MPENERTAQPVRVTPQQAREAAQAVAAYCLLPDPRPYFPNTQTWGEWVEDKLTKSVNELDTRACADRQIQGKIPGEQKLPTNDPRYTEIMRDAARRAAAGAAKCQWREFDDVQDEPYQYSGRIINGQCRPTRTRIR